MVSAFVAVGSRSFAVDRGAADADDDDVSVGLRLQPLADAY